MKKRLLSLALAAIMALGLAVPSLAAGQTFNDVPPEYWGYADIEAAAQAGYMNGTGGGAFSPEMKVSVAQFLTLLGRLVFPDVKAEGSDWYGPYVSAAQEAGLLAGTQVNVGNVEAEISRYDMAVILRAAAKKLGVAEKSAQSSEVTDFGIIPNMYTEAVLAVYGMGLIKGDQAGNFNGSNTMMRAEVATVIMRLKNALDKIEIENKQDEDAIEKRNKQIEQRQEELAEMVASNRTGEYITISAFGWISSDVHRDQFGNPLGVPDVQVGFYFMDGRLLGQAATDEKGIWRMEITIDKADYSETEEWYYTAIIGQAKEVLGGTEYTYETSQETLQNYQSGYGLEGFRRGKFGFPTIYTMIEERELTLEESRTGEYVTVNFYGRVSAAVPAGTRVGLYFKDGRLLGETTTDGSLDNTDYALWSMDITMDKADYSRTDAWYYAAVIGQAEDLIYGGMVETKDYDKRPESIWENTFNTSHGFLARTHSV